MFRRVYIVPFLAAATLLAAAIAVPGVAAAGDNVQRMTTAQLAERLGAPGVLVVDVRRKSDWERSDVKIQSAKRKPFTDIESWASDMDRGTTIVLYCA